MPQLPTISDIRQAAECLKTAAHRTPVLNSRLIDRICGTTVYFKCENLQRVGAFKFRGAYNAVHMLPEAERKKGVGTHSSGNHAAALALAAGLHGVPAHIVMPETAPQVKKEAVAAYGANITFCAPTLQAREKTMQTVQKETGVTFIHPYDNFYVIAGQGTAALELLEEKPQLDMLLTPVGGGGLTSGSAIALKAIKPKAKMIAVEPILADDAYRSFTSGELQPPRPPKTVADGLLTALSARTFAAIQKYVDEIVLVEEESIIKAMRLIWERMKIIVEPSSAVPLAGLLEGKIQVSEEEKVGIILSGGNVDLERLPWLKD